MNFDHRSAALHEREKEKAKYEENLGKNALIDSQMQIQIHGAASEVMSRAQVRCFYLLLSIAASVLQHAKRCKLVAYGGHQSRGGSC